MIQFASHISKGMEHIQAKGILHRRLAARNVFLARSPAVGLIAKVSGFGPMRGEEGKYGKKVADRIPIKWMAPESLAKEEGKERVYTKETDVWSFGITLWEIYSMGETPYPKQKSHGVEDLLRSGYRLPKPENCPVPLYHKIMDPCWSEDPKKRPTFEEITRQCGELFHEDEDSEFYYGPARQTTGLDEEYVYDNVAARGY
ncbi:hypothetical protein CAPTEDRAFT_151490 [Capitella teleta]|uniref:Protein kinase domain-containing protein n=1 Tax=Capitella teleta TaxID=283909 RepID=R7VEZ9_CAPTE|nr:hypothetical protein CAPTEDRAFT_151490 [Capitella teleta]|eukprot:ELU14235.1 hypothetical protein CAPTEDRAFT_151490 [Capitella teleta]